jgi:hypothetical protein
MAGKNANYNTKDFRQIALILQDAARVASVAQTKAPLLLREGWHPPSFGG